MKNRFLLVFVALFILAAPASAEKKLSEDIEAAVSALDDARESEHEKAERLALGLKQKYVEALTRTKNAAQKAGKLETILEVDAEIKSVDSGTEDQNAPKDTEVLKLKTVYTNSLATIQGKIDQKKAEADRRHAAEIDGIVTFLTKRGRIEEAKLVLSHKKPITKVSPPIEKPEIAEGPEDAEGAGTNLAKGKPYSSSHRPKDHVSDDGGVQLTNGLTMEETADDGVDLTVGWIGVKKLEVTIDLEESEKLSKFRAFVGSVHPHGKKHKINAPKKIVIFGSNTKEEWTLITSLENVEDVQGWKELKGKGKYRYVKFQFHSGSLWTMLSELEVYGE